MTYRFIEEETTSDIAFEATGKDLPDVFRSSTDAVMNAMVDNIDSIEPKETRHINLENEAIDLLLLDLLQSIVYYKDAEQLLLRLKDVEIFRTGKMWQMHAIASGDRLNAGKHHLLVDVKAVTLHHFELKRINGGWRAHVILDV